MSKRKSRVLSKHRVRRQQQADMTESAAKQDTMRAARRFWGQGGAK